MTAVPEPFHALGQHFAIDLPGARAVFTTRRGGVSRGPYASLNLGLNTDDDPAAVRANRALLRAGLGVSLAHVRQVHGNRVHLLDEGGVSADAPGGLVEADAVATTAHGRGPMVLTADCLPVALSDGTTVAVVHAGWQGLAAGVIAAGVAAVRGNGNGGIVGAAIGPGAGPCCYEVGPDLLERFADYGEDARRGRNLDLKLIARRQLERSGVAEVHDIGLCTICGDRELFFSHRRDRGVTGRQAGVAWLT